MKKFLFSIMAVLLCITMTGCGGKKEQNDSNRLKISLYSNASTGYSWSYTVSNEDIISISKYYDNSGCAKDVVGCGGNDVFTIKGLKPGKVTLSMKYAFVDPDERETKTAIYEITVNDDLSISETHSGTYFDEN